MITVKEIGIGQVEDIIKNNNIKLNQLDLNKNICYIIEEEGIFLGFGSFVIYGKACEIINIIIKEDFRNQGKGDFLLRGLLNKARSLNIEIALYKNTCGYLIKKGFLRHSYNEYKDFAIAINIDKFFTNNTCGNDYDC